jgi:hypothetical protein
MLLVLRVAAGCRVGSPVRRIREGSSRNGERPSQLCSQRPGCRKDPGLFHFHSQIGRNAGRMIALSNARFTVGSCLVRCRGQCFRRGTRQLTGQGSTALPVCGDRVHPVVAAHAAGARNDGIRWRVGRSEGLGFDSPTPPLDSSMGRAPHSPCASCGFESRSTDGQQIQAVPVARPSAGRECHIQLSKPRQFISGGPWHRASGVSRPRPAEAAIAAAGAPRDPSPGIRYPRPSL